MSEVITVGIQPRFKVRRNVGRRVNVSQFESHGAVFEHVAVNESIMDLDPTLSPAWVVRVRGHRSVTFPILPSSPREHDQRARGRPGKDHSARESADEHGRPFVERSPTNLRNLFWIIRVL